MVRPTRLIATVMVLLLGGAALSCASDGPGGAADGRLRVVTTTPLIAEFVERVAGEDASVESLIPRGVDLHSWQPPTSVARSVVQADVVIVNGYNLEESLLSIVRENVGVDVPIVVASAGIEPLAGGHDHAHEEHADHEGDSDEGRDGVALMTAEGDPHLWLAVPNAIRYVENIRDALVAADAGYAAGYEERAGDLLEELRGLDAEVREELAAIPEERRTIVVFHNAYQYLADEYGLEVVASVAPPNPNQETSAQAIAEVIEQVRALGITAVYREPEFSAQSLELIAQETGARVLELYNTPTDEVTTYAEMMRANVSALVDGLGG